MFQRSLAQDGAGPSRDPADTEEVGAEARDEDFNPDTEVRGKGKVEQESDEEKIVPKRRKKKVENSPEEPVRRKKKVENSIEEPSGRKKKVRNASEVPLPLPEVPLPSDDDDKETFVIQPKVINKKKTPNKVLKKKTPNSKKKTKLSPLRQQVKKMLSNTPKENIKRNLAKTSTFEVKENKLGSGGQPVLRIISPTPQHIVTEARRMSASSRRSSTCSSRSLTPKPEQSEQQSGAKEAAPAPANDPMWCPELKGTSSFSSMSSDYIDSPKANHIPENSLSESERGQVVANQGSRVPIIDTTGLTDLLDSVAPESNRATNGVTMTLSSSGAASTATLRIQQPGPGGPSIQAPVPAPVRSLSGVSMHPQSSHLGPRAFLSSQNPVMRLSSPHESSFLAQPQSTPMKETPLQSNSFSFNPGSQLRTDLSSSPATATSAQLQPPAKATPPHLKAVNIKKEAGAGAGEYIEDTALPPHDPADPLSRYYAQSQLAAAGVASTEGVNKYYSQVSAAPPPAPAPALTPAQIKQEALATPTPAPPPAAAALPPAVHIKTERAREPEREQSVSPPASAFPMVLVPDTEDSQYPGPGYPLQYPAQLMNGDPAAARPPAPSRGRGRGGAAVVRGRGVPAPVRGQPMLLPGRGRAGLVRGAVQPGVQRGGIRGAPRGQLMVRGARGQLPGHRGQPVMRGQPMVRGQLPARGQPGPVRGPMVRGRGLRGASPAPLRGGAAVMRPGVRPPIGRGRPAPRPAAPPQPRLPAQLANMNGLSITRQPPVEVPKNVRLPSGITLSHPRGIQNQPPPERRQYQPPPPRPQPLAQASGERKNKVTMELSQKQIDALKSLGML